MNEKRIKFRWLAKEVDVRNSIENDFPLMSVSQTKGVIPRSELKGDDGRADSLDNYKVCIPGQIVVNRMSASSGALGLAKQSGLVSPDYAVLAPTSLITPDFLQYLMKSSWFIGEMVARLKGIGAGGESASVRTPRINISDLGDVEVLVPSPEVQKQISKYLDTQMDIVRTLLANKQLKVESLEKMLCSQINSDLQNITSHSDKKPLRYLLSDMKTGGTPDEDLHSIDGVPWYSPASINNYGNLGDSVRTLPADAPMNSFVRFKFPGVLIVGIGATAGKVAHLDHLASGNQQLTCLTTNSLITSRFLYYYLLSERENLLARATYTTLPILNNEFLKSVEIVVPPMEIQLKLTEKWDNMKHVHEDSIEKIVASIKLIKEYSESLIANSIVNHSKAEKGAK
jgi:type I restriction enzyme S subunit